MIRTASERRRWLRCEPTHTAAITAAPGGDRYVSALGTDAVDRPIIGRQQLVGPAERDERQAAFRLTVRAIAWLITMMDDDGRVTDLKDASNCFTTLDAVSIFLLHTSH